MNFAKKLEEIDYNQRRLEMERMSVIEKAAKSSNPDDMIAAANAIEKLNKDASANVKSFFIDPLDISSNLGYKDKPYALTYNTLKRMAGTPIINAIIKTRKNQIADFAEPQNDQYSTGFVIRRKPKNGVEVKMSETDKKIANSITEFILNCGKESSWSGDDFDTFIRKIVDDSLTFDQMTFECIRNNKGELQRFIATDASTFRIAETAFKDDYDNPWFKREGSGLWFNSNAVNPNAKAIKGYYPQFVQIYQSRVVSEYYPWELCFAVRNPTTSIYSNGYGVSELEELINVVTSMLWGDEYNRKFFSQGSAPKGLLRVKGGMTEQTLQQFKQQWQAMISGVMQSWKTPVVQADVDWIDLQKNNRDMEYSSWMEYLIKLACAIYSIDPTEIGWDISRSGGNSGLFEGSQAERLQHSKDKGLYPMLKFIQRKIQKYIVDQINPDFEFVFMGLNGMTIEKELEMDMKKLNSFQTINEIRQKWDLPELKEGGDIIENPTFYQAYMASKQQQQGGMGMGGFGGGFGGGGGFDDDDDDWDDDEDEDENPFSSYLKNKSGGGNENPFSSYLSKNKKNDAGGDDTDADDDGNIRKSMFVKAFEEFLAKEEELNK